MRREEFDIAIIGGGMVGASLALMLAQKNPDWQIALLDSQPFAKLSEQHYQPSFDARSTAIAQGSVEILRALKLWDQLAIHATAIQQVHVSDAGHFMGGLIAANTYGLGAVGYVIENAWLGRVLLAQVQTTKNIDCLTPAHVTKIVPLQSGVQVHISFQDEPIAIKTQLAIVADGDQSPLRKSLGIDSTTKDYKQTALIANLAYSQAHQGVAYERFTVQGPMALLPLGESPNACESALVLTLPSNLAADVIALDDEKFLQYVQSRFGYRLGKFLRVSKRSAYELKLTTANEQFRSHLVMVGNAAHFLHPVAGQGFNLSLRDCACLVQTLSNAKKSHIALGDLGVLQRYYQQQQLDQKITIGFSDKLVQLFSSSSLPMVALRHLGFIGLEVLPSLKAQLAAQTMGTSSAKYY